MDQKWDWLKNPYDEEEEKQSSSVGSGLSKLLASKQSSEPSSADQGSMDPEVKNYLVSKQQAAPQESLSTAAKYQQALSDNKEVEEAKSRERWGSLIQGLLGAVNTAYGTGNNDSFNARKQKYADDVKAAEAGKQRRADAVLMADKLDRDSVKWGFEKAQLDRAENDAKLSADPASPESQLAQQIAAKMVPNQDFSKYTAAQIYKALPFVERQVSNSIQQRKLEQGEERLALGRDGLNLRTEKEDRLGKQFEVSQGNRMQDEVAKTIKMARDTETWKSAEKTLSNVPTMRNLLSDAYKQGGQSLSMLGPQVAKGIAGEVGVLTDKDVIRYVQNPAWVPGLMDTLAKVSEGKISEVSYENLNRLLDIAEKSARDKMELAYKNEAELYSRRRQGMSPQDAQFLIDPSFQKSDTPAPAPTQGASAPAQYDADKEARIKANMDKYGKSREDVIKAMQKKGLL